MFLVFDLNYEKKKKPNLIKKQFHLSIHVWTKFVISLIINRANIILPLWNLYFKIVCVQTFNLITCALVLSDLINHNQPLSNLPSILSRIVDVSNPLKLVFSLAWVTQETHHFTWLRLKIGLSGLATLAIHREIDKLVEWRLWLIYQIGK